jgi:3-oxoacyl-[acyl-carrier protein] reductase
MESKMPRENHNIQGVPQRLRDRVAIVTGAGHGIGKVYARRLASEGARVVVAELDGPAAHSVAEELTGAGLEAIAIQTDVADETSVSGMAQQTVDEFGRIDILVNNAAMFGTVPMSRLPFDEIPPDEWERMMQINLKGTWLACRAVVPEMRRRRYGKIVNISSGTALKGSASRIHYVTSKAGILGFTRTLAREVGRDGITVNCVAPGSTLSEEDPDESTLSLRQSAVADRAIPRVQKPEDLAGVVSFFASADSDFITGQTLVVDGGSIMH